MIEDIKRDLQRRRLISKGTARDMQSALAVDPERLIAELLEADIDVPDLLEAIDYIAVKTALQKVWKKHKPADPPPERYQPQYSAVFK